MREIVYYSRKAKTSGELKEERVDIIHRVYLNAFFISYKKRENLRLHFVFSGSDDPVKHIVIESHAEIPFRERDFEGFLRSILEGYREGENREVFDGVFIEKKSLLKVVEEARRGREVYVLSKKGRVRDLRELDNEAVFILGEIPLKELKALKRRYKIISLGNTEYLTSQAVSIINYLLDRRN